MYVDFRQAYILKNQKQFKTTFFFTRIMYSFSFLILMELLQSLPVQFLNFIQYRSDVKGQLYFLFGKSFVHEGITKFYDKIQKNGYEIIYLSARSHIQVNNSKKS